MAGNATGKQMLQDLPRHFGTVLIDPPWRFLNRTGKMAPEHKRLHRYPTISFRETPVFKIDRLMQSNVHL
jgi:hypothetical protein